MNFHEKSLRAKANNLGINKTKVKASSKCYPINYKFNNIVIETKTEVLIECQESQNTHVTSNMFFQEINIDLNQDDNSIEKKILEFDKLIKMAFADGLLTPNEEKMLEAEAKELGLNYSDYKLIIESLKQKQNFKETQIININKQQGNDFEDYIVQKFPKDYFILLEWRGDKYINGFYSKSNLLPDLQLKTNRGDNATSFAVECKYRSNYVCNEINWSHDKQIENYKKYEIEKKINVFIALGIGGTAKSPNELFIIPLKDIHYIYMSKEFLAKYKRANTHHNFFFDSSTNELR